MADSFGISYIESERAVDAAIADLKQLGFVIDDLKKKNIAPKDKAAGVELIANSLRKFINLGKDLDAVTFNKYETSLLSVAGSLGKLKLSTERTIDVLDQGLRGTLDVTAKDFQGKGKAIVRAVNEAIQAIVEMKNELTDLRSVEERRSGITDLAKQSPLTDKVTPGNLNDFIELNRVEQQYIDLLSTGKASVTSYFQAINELRAGKQQINVINNEELALLSNLVNKEREVAQAIQERDRAERDAIETSQRQAQVDALIFNVSARGGVSGPSNPLLAANLAITQSMQAMRAAFIEAGEPVQNLEALLDQFAKGQLEITEANYKLIPSLLAVAAARDKASNEVGFKERSIAAEDIAQKNPVFDKVTPENINDFIQMTGAQARWLELLKNGKEPLDNYVRALNAVRAGQVEVTDVSRDALITINSIVDGEKAAAKALEDKAKAAAEATEEEKRLADIERVINEIRVKAATGGSGAFKAVNPNDLAAVVTLERALKGLQTTMVNSKRPVAELANEIHKFENNQLQASESNYELVSSLRAITKESTVTAKAAKDMSIQFSEFARFIEFRLISQAFFTFTNALRRNRDEAFLFSKAVREIQTIAQDMPQTFEDWSQSLLNLSNRFNLPLLDVAEAQYETLSNQVAEGSDNFYFMAEAAQFAIAAVSSMGDSVNLLSSILNSFQLDVSKTREEAAKLFKAIDVGRFRAGDISDSLGRVGPFAAQLGVKTEELEGTLAQLTIVGIPASEAMTQLRNIFTKLIKPTDEMKKLFNEMGVSGGEAAVKAFGFVGVLDRLATATHGSSSELAELFNNIRGLTGAITLTRFLDDTKQKIDEIANATNEYDVALKKNFENSGFIVQQQMNIVKNSIIEAMGSLIDFVAMSQKFADSVAGDFGLKIDLGGVGAIIAKLAIVTGLVQSLRFFFDFMSFKTIPAFIGQVTKAATGTAAVGAATASTAASLTELADGTKVATAGLANASKGMAAFRTAAARGGAIFLAGALGLELLWSIEGLLNDMNFKKINDDLQQTADTLERGLNANLRKFSQAFKNDYEPVFLTFNALIANTRANLNKEAEQMSEAFTRIRKAIQSGNRAASAELLSDESSKLASKALDAQLEDQFEKIERSLDRKPKSAQRTALLDFYRDQIAQAEQLIEDGNTELADKAIKFAEKALAGAVSNSTTAQKKELEPLFDQLAAAKQSSILGSNVDLVALNANIFADLPKTQENVALVTATVRAGREEVDALLKKAQDTFNDPNATFAEYVKAIEALQAKTSEYNDMQITLFSEEEGEQRQTLLDTLNQSLELKREMYILSLLETQQQKVQLQLQQAKTDKEKAERGRLIAGEQFTQGISEKFKSSSSAIGVLDRAFLNQVEGTKFEAGVQFTQGEFKDTLIDLQAGLAVGDKEAALKNAKKIKEQTGNILASPDAADTVFGDNISDIKAANKEATNFIESLEKGKLAELDKINEGADKILVAGEAFVEAGKAVNELVTKNNIELGLPPTKIEFDPVKGIEDATGTLNQYVADVAKGVGAKGTLDPNSIVIPNEANAQAARTVTPNIQSPQEVAALQAEVNPTLLAPTGGTGIPPSVDPRAMTDAIRYSQENQEIGRAY